MRVKVEIWIDIKDPSQWTAAYGVEGAAGIRADVKSYVGNLLQQSAALSDEVDAEITWK